MQGANAYEALRLIFFSSGYGEYHSRTFGDTVKRNVLLAIAYRHPSREGFFRRLKELEDLTKRGSVGEGGVILSTIHSAKGMEFDAVILCDCQNGILPSVTVPSGVMVASTSVTYPSSASGASSIKVKMRWAPANAMAMELIC